MAFTAGISLAAKSSAAETWIWRPSSPAWAMLRVLPSFPPAADLQAPVMQDMAHDQYVGRGHRVGEKVASVERKPRREPMLRRIGIEMRLPLIVVPDYKKGEPYGASASIFARASRFATEETCHRLP